MAEIFITSQNLIDTLKISSRELINIEKFFDSILDDEWELTEGKDYKVVNKTTGLREYTSSGAYAIARYLELTKKQSWLEIIKEWFSHTKRDIRRAFVKKKILDNCSSLVKRNNQYFISKTDVVAIFGTRPDYLAKMAEYVKSTDSPLIKGEDYDDFGDEDGLRYSLSGIYKLAEALKKKLSQKNRKEWCADVKEVIKLQIDEIIVQIANRDKQIQAAINRAKKRDEKTCQITKEKSDRISKLNLVVHHLYSRNEYPHLAAVDDNLITLTGRIHEQFHNDFMGGYTKPCTVDDLISFIQKYYPTNTKVVISLEQRKRILGNPKPLSKRERHVLYLSASKLK